jgi:aminopeptidase N
MGASYYTADRNLGVPNSLDFTVAHEVAHQWWYGMVGNNQYDHAFIDEGLTNFMSSDMYFDAMYGSEVAETMVERYLIGPFHSHVSTGNDQVVNTPTDEFPSSSAYVFAVYSKAPLGFKAIYEEIGHEAFVDGVQRYYKEHRFSIATPEDLLVAFETAANQNISDLWNHWFEEASGEDDI